MMTQPSPVETAPQVWSAGEAWSLASVLSAARRWRKLLLRSVLIVLALAVAYCGFATPRYRATGQIQVQKEASGAFGLENSVMGRDDNSVSSDSLDYNIMLQTEAGILQSDALALTVIHDLELETTADYFPQKAKPSPFVWLHAAVGALLFWREPLEPLAIPLERAPNRRYEALKIFAGHLKVQPVTGTRLIEVSYSDPNPERAAAVVNRLIAELGEFTFQQQFTATLQGSSWLTGQLADLRRQMDTLQAKAIALQRDTGMFGNDATRNIVLERLASLNQTLTQAESNRILKEAIDRVAASGDPELISSLSGNSSVGAVASVTNTLSLIQGLRTQEATLRAELAQDTVRYGPAYPRLGELEAQLGGVERSIQDEVHRLGQRAHSDYLVAVREEAGARSAFEEQKRAASKLSDSLVAYGVAKQEADSSRDIYENLLAKLKQAGVLGGLKANNISIVALALVPPPAHPSSPRVALVLLLAVLAGLGIGGTLAAVAELTDNKLGSFEGIERAMGIPLLAVLPTFERPATRKLGALRIFGRLHAPEDSARASNRRLQAPRGPVHLAALDAQPSTFAEGLRSLRTALLLSRSGRPPQVLLVTSCLEKEGKTTLALNLAAALAQDGSRVLLVDADLRKPTLAAYFGSEGVPGLGTVLTSPARSQMRHPVPALPNFAVLCGIEAPPGPSELLGSARMRELLSGWKADYDFILMDSAPVLPVTDAVLLSQLSDATLLVARHGQTTRQALRRSTEALRRQQPPNAALGMVLNAVARDSGDFYDYFGYQASLYAAEGAHA